MSLVFFSVCLFFSVCMCVYFEEKDFSYALYILKREEEKW
jgi:hypothetical protein